MSSSRTDVLVVGAGPVGLTAAAVLATQGVSARVIDAGAGLTTQSRALGVQSRTIELWDKLGLADRAVATGQRAARLYARKGGRALNGDRPLLNLGATSGDLTPYPFMLILEQSKTEQLLHQQLHELWRDTAEAGHDVEWHTRLTGLRLGHDDRAPVTATLQRPDGTHESVEADWVIGADGASSTVRKALGVSFEGGTYEEEFFLADVTLDGVTDLGPEEGLLDFADDGLLVFLPMTGDDYGDRRFRVLGVAPPEVSGRQNLSSAEVQQVIEKHSSVRATVSATYWTSTYRLHHRMAGRFRVGRVFLAGDSAHVHSPIGGQGMNTGIQDAYNLGWKLGLVARGRAEESLLDSYEPERLPVARALLKGSDQAFSLVLQKKEGLARWARSAAIGLAPRLISRLRLDKKLFHTVSQTGIGYPDSPAVASLAGRQQFPAPGDRAPHAVLATGEHAGQSVLSLLRGPALHILVFADDEATGRENAAALTAAAGRFAVPTQVHLLGLGEHDTRRAYRVTGPTAILVRPDGYLAWRGPADSPTALTAVLERWYRPVPAAAQRW